MNLFSLAKTFPTEDEALAYWIKARWPDGVRCLGCEHDKVYLIETKGTTGKPYRKFECGACGLHFSPTAGTIFHDSHLPLQKWFAAIALVTDAKKGISASQLGRHLGIAYKTAWHLCHRIREAMQEPADMKLGGESTTVEIDETFVGGRKRLQGRKVGKQSKTRVVGMAERGGRIHLKTVKSGQTQHVQPVVSAKLDSETPAVVTDGDGKYKTFIPRDRHVIGIHRRELRNKNWTSTQTVENAFSLFKRGIVGQYHQLSAEHLDRYLGEFCWRYNRRRMQPWMFDMVLANMAKTKPLPYKDLIF